jgi:CRP-like cAMP-binding protein
VSPESRSLAVGRTDRLIALRRFSAFSTLTPEEALTIANRAKERRFAPGEAMYHEDEPIGEVAFVLRGEVQTQRHGKILGTYGSRSVLGSVALLAELSEGYGAIATKPTIALMLPAEEMLEVFEDHFEVVRSALRGLASGLLDIRREMGTGGFHETDWEPTGEPPPPPLDLVGRIAQLRDAMPFAGARMEALADLARDVREARLEAGHSLWKEGDPSDAFFFLLHGTVAAESTSGMAMTFGPGDVVGSLGTLAGQDRWYSATTSSELVALRLDAETLLDVMEDHFDFAMAMVRSMARGYLSLMEKTTPEP